MVKDCATALQFQRAQQDAVMSIGAYLAPVIDFIEKSGADLSYAGDINNIRRLLSHVGESNDLLAVVTNFIDVNGYNVYLREVTRPCSAFMNLLAQQTIPSKKTELNVLINALKVACNVMAEGMIAIAHIPLPHIDINIKAESSFEAYCFFTDLFLAVKESLYIIDPYIDSSLFYRYLYHLPCTTDIQVVSFSKKWGKSVKEQVEDAETVFSTKYPKYVRKDADDLHDRYLITELSAFQLGGSLKDAAKNADFSITQVSEAQRLELIEKYFSRLG